MIRISILVSIILLLISCGRPPEPPISRYQLTMHTGHSDPEEISWEILSDDNVVESSFDEYSEAKKASSISFDLTDGSYRIVLKDEVGDGWSGAYYTIKDVFGNIIWCGSLPDGKTDTVRFFAPSLSGVPDVCDEPAAVSIEGSWRFKNGKRYIYDGGDPSDYEVFDYSSFPEAIAFNPMTSIDSCEKDETIWDFTATGLNIGASGVYFYTFSDRYDYVEIGTGSIIRYYDIKAIDNTIGGALVLQTAKESYTENAVAKKQYSVLTFEKE